MTQKLEGKIAVGVELRWGRSGSKVQLTCAEAPINDGGAHLEDAMGALR